jgi:tellurite resistance-related uncharacterized protein
MLTALPPGLTAYKRTAIFDQDSLPSGLQHQHSTKAGVWALIQVIDGSIRYRILDPRSETVLTPQRPGIVQPQQLHEVELLGPVRLFVEFYAAAAPAGGPHEQKVF